MLSFNLRKLGLHGSENRIRIADVQVAFVFIIFDTPQLTVKCIFLRFLIIKLLYHWLEQYPWFPCGENITSLIMCWHSHCGRLEGQCWRFYTQCFGDLCRLNSYIFLYGWTMSCGMFSFNKICKTGIWKYTTAELNLSVKC